MIRRLVPLMLLAAGAAPPASADTLALADSFRIGSTGVLCTAQAQVADPAVKGLFDRGYSIVCRDAATPVGSLYALRSGAPALPPGCPPPASATVAGLPGVSVSRCTVAGLVRVQYQLRRGKTLFVADGLGGYASALQLGLQSLASDAPVSGTVDVAATEAGDPAAFARLQAGSLEPGKALAEAYARNNAASYAESSEYFDLLVERNRQGAPGFTRSAEYLANQGLQQSNLTRFAEADRLFARAAQGLDASDPVASRLLRNALAQHLLNQRRNDEALAVLARPVTGNVGTTETTRLAAGFIDVPMSQRLNTDDGAMRSLSAGSASLSPEERVAILDAQAQYLAAAARAGQGELAAADSALAEAQTRLARLRGGRVLSILWLRAAIAGERALVGERLGRATDAKTALTEAVALTEAQFPQSAALLAVRAQLAALLLRQGDAASGTALFRAIVTAAPDTPGAGQVLRPLLAPWVAALAAKGDAAAAADLFDAAQILVRPGVAQTQAVLARELSGGSDAAAALFRQSLTLSRDLVRTQGDIARLAQIDTPTAFEQEQLASLRETLAQLGRDQTAVLARLAEYPRYRSISNGSVTMASLQQALKPGEAYYKLVLLGDDAYALTISRDNAAVARIAATAPQLGQLVKIIRDSVVIFENGRPTTYPFDAPAARRLFALLTGPADGATAKLVLASRHLIAEPDGALLQLPFNLLITADDAMAAYQARQDDPNADPFDTRGLHWLGRDRMISTATSARAFIDVRALAASHAANAYLGLGENAVPATPIPAPARADCDWPLSEWGHPIASAELRFAADILKAGGARVDTGAAFTDDALMTRTDLRDYRVIHFATHGLVTAPRPECPARPALLTSFGGAGSDGLLSFRDIFDLRLDADTIILSACDTAGAATASATREAGITTGGNFALDGLVRAFVGAGARAVIASHWPVPDSFNATRTLIGGLFADAGSISVGEALRRSQVAMMDRAETSHPYYWAGFAIIGDAAKPLMAAPAAAQQGR
ncbi:MAG: CHAT domain-containing protein [Sphingomonadales bacterium]|jgi:CHAT domain-containing protein